MQPEPGSVRRFGHETQQQLVLGPHRVYPGRLSVSRTFGDIEAKRVKYGGNPIHDSQENQHRTTKSSSRR